MYGFVVYLRFRALVEALEVGEVVVGQWAQHAAELRRIGPGNEAAGARRRSQLLLLLDALVIVSRKEVYCCSRRPGSVDGGGGGTDRPLGRSYF
jgi:hypothetical protein